MTPLTDSARQQVEQLRDLEPWSDSARAALWSRIDASTQRRTVNGPLVRWIAVAAIGLAVIALWSKSRHEVTRLPIAVHVPPPIAPQVPIVARVAPAAEPVAKPVRRTVAIAHAPDRAKPATRITGSAPQFAASSRAVALSITTDKIELARTFEQCAVLATPGEQQTCYAALAAGDGPEAGNALYALAVLDRDVVLDRAAALHALRAYQRRFADGPLAPEVALAIIAELRRDRCSAAALAELDRFLRRYPGDERAAALVRLRASLTACAGAAR